MEALTMLNASNTFSPALLKFQSSSSALSCRKSTRFLESSSCNSSRGALVAKNVAVRGLEATEIPKEDCKSSRPLPSPRPLEDAGKSLPAPLMEVKVESLQYEAGFIGGISEKTRTVPDCEEVPAAISYLTGILSSRVYDVAIETPLHFAPKLSHKTGVNIRLKREDLQPVFSFKLRGAYNMMAKLPQEQLERGVICSSAGNHAQGVALAAQRLNCDAVIVMPLTTPEIKWKSVERLGATVVLFGDSYDDAQHYAKKRCEEEGRTFIPPFDHPDVIAGQGTVGMEIIRQHQGPLHAVFVPVGGGGLIAGIASYIKQVRPEVRIIGVEPADANAMALSLHHGKRVILEHVGGFADGVAVKVVGEETFRLCRELLDGVVLVGRDAICASIKDMFEEKRSILEPAGALALAGAKAYCKYYGLKDETVVAITSGANMNFGRLGLVTELADVGAQREAVLATFLPEELGSFKKFCHLVGSTNITEFKYRCDPNKDEALVLYSVGIHTDVDLKAMKGRMTSSGFKTIDLTDNDLAKDHLRHLMGGRAAVENELICRFVFPERPGALMKFLDTFSPRWNISLFHYRAQGEMGANVLVGMQVPAEDTQEFSARACSLGYEYEDERHNEALKLLLTKLA
ncbi:threonine dehydratase 1 biosynthetic, chloroplastic isoform X1 [Cryptomeria japonica]|uniref:threonine dehydratase 1 biosynthetic, chloroplastic isoform X1 n=1 Tax=Cryptomeria japonica TaxID=3369 RepID=UPI0025ABAB73|nr:threonine dehydratase 1 biosynthetic, chloroplastic isoform X1 [Cryptomeria japonica]